MKHDRATTILALVRIVAVLGMAFSISLGIFMLLGGWWRPSLVAFVCFVPFFAAMRWMEKRAARDSA